MSADWLTFDWDWYIDNSNPARSLMIQFNCHRFASFAVAILVTVFAINADLHARQDKGEDKNPLLDVMKYRSIGPFRGGRSCAWRRDLEISRRW